MSDVRHFADRAAIKILDFVEAAKDNPQKFTEPSHWMVPRRQIVEAIQDGTKELGETPSWKLARYAVVCLADDLLKRTQWPGQAWWTNNLLEHEMFQMAVGSEEFFQCAKEATKIADRKAVTVFYLCGILGLRGFYGEPDAMVRAQQLGLPLSFEAWIAETSAAVRPSEITGPPAVTRDNLEGAGPLWGRTNFMSMMIITIGLFLIAGMFGFVTLILPNI